MRVAATFWSGVLIGGLLTAAFFGGSLWHLSRRGLTVSLDTAALAQQIEIQVRDHVRGQLPETLRQVRRDLPPLVAAQVARRFEGDRVQLGPVEVEVPPTVARELEHRLTQALTEAAGHLLDEVDTARVSDRIAREAAQLVHQRLTSVTAAWRPALHPFPWVTIPVHLRAEN